MASVLSLAIKINADASGLKLDPVERALKQLGAETDKVTSIFDRFTSASEGAARAQAATDKALTDLTAARVAGTVSAEQFAESFNKIRDAATQQAAAFAEGQRLTEANRTEEEKRAIALARLNELLELGAIDQENFNRASAVASGANAEAARLAAESAQAQAEAVRLQAEGQRITEANRTEEERRAITLARLNELFDQGAIGQETFSRATAEASGANAEASRVAAEAAQQQSEAAKVQADALRQRQALESRAASIINANLTAQERYEQSLRELNDLQRQGLLTQEQYNRAVTAARKPLEDSAAAAEKAANANKQSTLQFNELSGIFAALPGPLGNIAGRISGLASAGQGLSRIFAGGLKTGLTSIASSVTALINPFTLALAGITAFAAGAVAVVRGLVALEDRVERLSRLSTQLGVSFEFVQVLEEAGRRADVSIEQLSGSFARLQNTLAGADEESKKAQTALQRLGVSVQDFGALSEQQRIDLIGERLAAIEDPAQRSAAAIALFGRSGVALLPFFNELTGAADDMERFGRALSDAQRRDIAEFGASMDRLGVATGSASNQLLAEFSPAAARAADAASVAAGAVARNSDVVASALGNTVNALTGGTLTVLDLAARAIGLFSDNSQEATAAAQGTAEAVARSAEEVDALNKAFAGSQKGLDAAIAKAGEFGQAGFDAAFEFEQALADLQEQAGENELNAEQYARGVANATAEFEKQIDVVQRVAEENRRLAEEAQRRAEAEAKAVQDIIDANLEQIRVDEQFRGDSQRAQAADNLLKLQQEQLRVEEQLQAARASGDVEAINALTGRLATLDQVAARERDIASGAAKDREAAAKAADDLNDKLFADAQKRADAEAAIREQIAAQEQKLQDRVFEIEQARLEELAATRTGAVQINDIRSGGIGALFDTLREDPAISEAKKQTKELTEIRKGIAALEADRVDILAGTG
jgi:hypothetical protein